MLFQCCVCDCEPLQRLFCGILEDAIFREEITRNEESQIQGWRQITLSVLGVIICVNGIWQGIVQIKLLGKFIIMN